MKIGASPLYLLSGQEQELEKKTEHLKSVEKEAYLKIKEQKIINDDDESPAIRVALRNIKDFATPFKFKKKLCGDICLRRTMKLKNYCLQLKP